MCRTQHVANALIMAGLDASISPAEDDCSDDSVNLTDGVYVQVGCGYLMLNKMVEEKDDVAVYSNSKCYKKVDEEMLWEIAFAMTSSGIYDPEASD